MAFKILSQDEIQKLTSVERKNYEQLYAEYQEREAFVNRLERQRKVKVPRFKIKKRYMKNFLIPQNYNKRFGVFEADISEFSSNILNATNCVNKTLSKYKKVDFVNKHSVTLPDIPNVGLKFTNKKINRFYVSKPNKVVSINPKNINCEFSDVQLNLKESYVATPSLKNVQIGKLELIKTNGVFIATAQIPSVKIQNNITKKLPLVFTNVPDEINTDFVPMKLQVLPYIHVSKSYLTKKSIKTYKMTDLPKSEINFPKVSLNRKPINIEINSSEVIIPTSKVENYKLKPVNITKPKTTYIENNVNEFEKPEMSKVILSSVVIPKTAKIVGKCTTSEKLNQVKVKSIDSPTISFSISEPKIELSHGVVVTPPKINFEYKNSIHRA